MSRDGKVASSRFRVPMCVLIDVAQRAHRKSSTINKNKALSAFLEESVGVPVQPMVLLSTNSVHICALQ